MPDVRVGRRNSGNSSGVLGNGYDCRVAAAVRGDDGSSVVGHRNVSATELVIGTVVVHLHGDLERPIDVAGGADNIVDLRDYRGIYRIGIAVEGDVLAVAVILKHDGV